VALAKAYLKRWGVEEAGRLIKQVFDLENLRVLTWSGLQKLAGCRKSLVFNDCGVTLHLVFSILILERRQAPAFASKFIQ